MAVETLNDLFEYQLQSIYYVEKELVDALDEMQTSATNGQLVEAFADHRDETKRHVERLEEVFAALGVPAETRNVPSVDGLREEKRTFDAAARDTDLQNVFYAQAGRRAEQLEITAYQGLLDLADRLDASTEVVDLLEQNWREEQAALEKLEGISGSSEFESLVSRLL